MTPPLTEHAAFNRPASGAALSPPPEVAPTKHGHDALAGIARLIDRLKQHIKEVK